MAELSPPANPFVQMIFGEGPSRAPLYCPGPPTPEFGVIFRKVARCEDSPVLIGSDDYLIPQRLGFDAVSLWQFRSPRKDPLSLQNGESIDAWGRRKRGRWYLNEGVLGGERAWADWIDAGFYSYPPNSEFEALTSHLQGVTQGALRGMAFDASIAGAFEKAWQSMGFARFARAVKKEDPLIGTALDHLLSFSLGMAERWHRLVGARVFLVTDDMAYKGRPLISPGDWETWVLPRYQTFTNKLHARGCKVILHSDGQVEPLIPLFIKAGFDAIQALEPAAGVDLTRVMRRYKNGIMLIGNLDVSGVLVYGTPAQVEHQTQMILKEAQRSRACLAISPSQQIDEHCPPANILAMCKTARDFTFSQVA